MLGEWADVSPQCNDDVVEVQASSPKEMEVLSTRRIMELSCAHHQAWTFPILGLKLEGECG